MSSFFEKRIMADIERRVTTLWPGIDAHVVSSAYNDDGLCLRVWVTEDVYLDTTIFNGRWTAIFGAAGKSFRLTPDPRLFEPYPLSVGAPARQVAPEIVKYLRANWESLAGLKAAMMPTAEGGN
jgi:hypothetical protein